MNAAIAAVAALTVADLVRRIVDLARRIGVKLVALELVELFEGDDVAAFAARWFAGSASSGALRARLVHEIEALALLVGEKQRDAVATGDVRRVADLDALGRALGQLAVIVRNGDRYGMRGGKTNAQRYDERRRAIRALCDACD